jgi:hypothetical protein
MSDLKRLIKTTIVYSNPFGDYCKLEIPANCNVVVLAVNNGYGLIPVKLLLPHQVYVKVIEDLVKEHNAKEIVAIPANSENYISIVGNAF